MFGTSTPAVPDIDRTDFFLIIGANPIVSNGSLVTAPDFKRRIESLQKRGGKLIVIDPRRTETADIADIHFHIRPGGDAFLLLAILNTLFAEDRINLGRLKNHVCGLETIENLSREFPPDKVASAYGSYWSKDQSYKLF